MMTEGQCCGLSVYGPLMPKVMELGGRASGDEGKVP